MASLLWLVRTRREMADARLVGPIFPRAPGLDRIRRIATIARVDLALAKILDLAAERLGLLQRARVSRQINGHSHHLDQRPGGGGEAMAAHQCNVILAETLGEIAA